MATGATWSGWMLMTKRLGASAGALHADGKAAGGQAAHPQVVGRPQQQRKKAHEAHRVAERGAPAGRAEVLAQHAQRRHAAQLHQRRQRKAQQQHQSDRPALQRRPQRRLRQAGLDQRAQHLQEHEVEPVTDGHAHRAGGHADVDELQRKQAKDVGLRQPQAAHHGAGVEVAQREAPGRRGHRHRRDHRGQQCHQRQEAFGPLQGALHLGPAAFERFELLTAAQLAAHGAGEGLDLRPLARHQQAVGDAAAGLDQLGRRQVGEVEHHARRKVDELRAAVGLDGDEPLDAEGLLAQLELATDVDAQRLHRLWVHPDVARRGNGAGRLVGGIEAALHAQGAAQRIAVGHGLDCGQRGEVAVARVQRHARKDHGLRLREAGIARALAHISPQRSIGTDHGIGGQQLRGVALQPEADAVDEETHAGHGGHRDHQRAGQQAQFAGAPVAQGHAPGLVEDSGEGHEVAVLAAVGVGAAAGFIGCPAM
jgi:hypothetical protein